jgi:hypothetical protein
MKRLDDLTGTTVFTALYRKHVTSTDFPDLTDAYAELGLEVHAGEIELQSARYGHLRDAIMRLKAVTSLMRRYRQVDL